MQTVQSTTKKLFDENAKPLQEKVQLKEEYQKERDAVILSPNYFTYSIELQLIYSIIHSCCT